MSCIKFLTNRFVRSLCLFFLKKKTKPLSDGLFGVQTNE
jgi:hypothetical protein